MDKYNVYLITFGPAVAGGQTLPVAARESLAWSVSWGAAALIRAETNRDLKRAGWLWTDGDRVESGWRRDGVKVAVRIVDWPEAPRLADVPEGFPASTVAERIAAVGAVAAFDSDFPGVAVTLCDTCGVAPADGDDTLCWYCRPASPIESPEAVALRMAADADALADALAASGDALAVAAVALDGYAYRLERIGYTVAADSARRDANSARVAAHAARYAGRRA